jgi:hypothetical protein
MPNPKVGRKPLFHKAMIEEAYRLGALGLTVEEIADFWKIRRTSLYRWTKKHPELGDTIKRGRDEADMTVVQSLLKQAKEGNITGIIFWLKNRQPKAWRDRHEVSGVVEHAHTHFFQQMVKKAEDLDLHSPVVPKQIMQRIATRVRSDKKVKKNGH